MKIFSVAVLSGLLFGIGLTISGMAVPQKVLGFLTLGPSWDPTLLWVMGGALLISLPGFFVLRRRTKPWLTSSFTRPGGRIDRRLLLGAALFGIGWGLAGYCPGPAVVSLSLLQGAALLFFPAMLVGAGLARRL